MSVETTIRFDERSKDIPYPPDLRADSIGYGFKNLKCRQELVSTIPEVTQMQGMKKAIRAISRSETPFFSIGCEKRFGEHGPRDCWARGYIEFAYNFEIAAWYENYEQLLEKFEKSTPFRSISSPTRIEWVIAPIVLFETKIVIHSCSVWVTISDRKTHEKAKTAFDQTYSALGIFLGTIRIKDHDLKPLFSSQ